MVVSLVAHSAAQTECRSDSPWAEYSASHWADAKVVSLVVATAAVLVMWRAVGRAVPSVGATADLLGALRVGHLAAGRVADSVESLAGHWGDRKDKQ